MPIAKQASQLTIEDLTLSLHDEIHVRASIETTFQALLEQLGPLNGVPESGPMPMKLEAWPGGRWYRPTLLELSGPLFMSYPVSSNLQYRLSEEPGGTLIKFRHLALGLIEDDHRKGVVRGWSTIHAHVKAAAEGARAH